MFRRIEFDATITKNPQAGYRIWIPKSVVNTLPESLWIIETTFIRNGGFKQTLPNHVLSKAGGGKKYIGILAEDDEGIPYHQMGKFKVEMVFEI